MKPYPLLEGLVRRVGRVLLLLLAISVVVGQPTEAKTYAYIISRDLSVLKLDTETDTIVSNQTLSVRQRMASGGRNVYVSGPDDLLLMSYATSQTKGDVNDLRIVAFKLWALKFKKDLGRVWPERPHVLIPPTGLNLFILWLDPDANSGQGVRKLSTRMRHSRA
jgi:hypothetical protein